ncbi:MAG: phosphatidate cytidylyltransferase [Muribaculaceae bacterium]|nr:phosphatidate cytidylyltransferase [Muribaculaceae bacterium]
MLKRAVSGAVYVAIIVGALLGGGLWTCALAVMFCMLAALEFDDLVEERHSYEKIVGITDIVGTLCLTVGISGYGLLLWLLVLLVRMIEELYLRESDPLYNLALSVFAQIYLGLPCGILFGVGVVDYFGEMYYSLPTKEILHVTLAIFVLIWLNDTGAYLVGSWLGKHKMIERISPKKTWEGFAGGVIFCVGGATACYWIMPMGYYPVLWSWIGLGVVVALFSTWGDLVESLFKRDIGVKDSGNLIPGHGGILDRIDSFLLVMPASLVYLFATWLL